MILNQEQAAWYLAGIIDGEGHVNATLNQFKVAIYNTDNDIIAATQESLDILNIEYRTYTRLRKDPNHKVCREIAITKRHEIAKLASYIELQSTTKRERLLSIVRSPQRYAAPDDPRIDQIRELYGEGYSQREIASALTMNRRQVQSMMTNNGIDVRPRGGPSMSSTSGSAGRGGVRFKSRRK